MAQKPIKRRVVPQMISPASAALAAQQNPLGSAGACEPAGVTAPVSLKEQAEAAKQHLGPGRRMFVSLGDCKVPGVVNYRALLKEAGVPFKQDGRGKGQEQGGEGNGQGGAPGAERDAPSALPPMLEIGRSAQGGNNIFASVIQRLESAYVRKHSDDDDGDSSGSDGGRVLLTDSDAASDARSSSGDESDEMAGAAAAG